MKRTILICLLLFAVWVLWGNTALEVNEWTIESSALPEQFDGFRIAQVSDLHNASFGDGNEKLLELLDQANPDIIVLTGDLADSRNTDVDIALAFAAEAVEIAPCYYVSGNHEARIAQWQQLRAGLLDAGVTLLEDEAVTMERDGAAVTLAGLQDPSFGTNIAAGLRELTQDQTLYTILLSHRPELFELYVSCGADLVFSGHAHGGQVRLPFVGGLVAPNQGFFPEYDSGLYQRGDTSMLVSRGIGNSIIPLRFNNRPEIVLAVLRCG